MQERNLIAFSDKIVILLAVTAPIENFFVTCLTCTPHNAIWFLTVVLSELLQSSRNIPKPQNPKYACPIRECAVSIMPLTLLGAPVSIGETRVTVSRRQDRDLSSRPPGTGPHVPVRHNRGSDAIHSSRSPWRLGLNQIVSLLGERERGAGVGASQTQRGAPPQLVHRA